jgi:hypothetical protein
VLGQPVGKIYPIEPVRYVETRLHMASEGGEAVARIAADLPADQQRATRIAALPQDSFELKFALEWQQDMFECRGMELHHHSLVLTNNLGEMNLDAVS